MYFERSNERFDLIYLPSVGGYPQMMIEPGNMIRTFEAYRTLRDHLTERGCLAVWYPKGLDPQGVLTRQYTLSLRSLNMSAQAYQNEQEFLILSYRDRSRTPPDETELVKHVFHRPKQEFEADPVGFRRLFPVSYRVEAEPSFRPITDDRPFLAGNVSHILASKQVWKMLGVLAGVWAFLGFLALLLLPKGPGTSRSNRSFLWISGFSFLVGFNFLAVEHIAVLALFKRIYVYDDSLAVGAIGFLILSGVGSMAAGWKHRSILIASGLVGLAGVCFLGRHLSLVWVLTALAPLAVATGTFFPLLFEKASSQPLTVFAFDAMGAGAGALAATFTPILYGFPAYTALGAGVFVVTATVDVLFHRRIMKLEISSPA